MVNKVILIGNLAADPDVKATPKGVYVANIRLATHTYLGKDEEGKAKEETEYHRLVAFGKLAEFAGQYLKKGRAVYAEGRLRTSSWEGTWENGFGLPAEPRGGSTGRWRGGRGVATKRKSSTPSASRS